jgi:2'-hydroxyisoflavone reductase
VDLLVIGGTEFVGRAVVELAVERSHRVTVFHRGQAEPADMPAVDHVHGDRDGGLDALGDRTWDAALDTCGYVPRVVRDAARLLAGRTDLYAFVSTLSVHADELPAGGNEDSPVHQPPFPDTEEVTGETYGPLKVACELAVTEEVGEDRAFVIRPGYIVGPHDPTDRFVSWLRRAGAGGTMPVPGRPDEPLQVVDVRDLGAFILDGIEAGRTGTYAVVGPGEPLTFERFLRTAVEVAGATTDLVWIGDERAMAEASDEEERYELWPMWHPEFDGVHRFDVSKARGAGLQHRPFEDTVRDTIAWDRSRPQEPLPHGVPLEREARLLAEITG